MSHERNKKKNIYIIGIVVGVAFMIIYGYGLYRAKLLNQDSRVYWDLGIMAAWFFLTIYWLRQLGNIAKKKEEED